MIEIDQLEYVHANGIPALRGVKATLESGRWTALIGANGSGKTTLARCLNGLLTPTSGAVRVDGVTVARDSVAEIRQRVAMVFQNPDDQLVAPTVETDIAFGLENHGVEPTQMRSRVEEILRRFHLDHYRSHPPHLLSGGERQRLAVAAAVAVQPDFLILDEPTALLDPTARAELMDLVGQLCQQGLGVLHITQSPEEAARAERILVLHEGLLVDDGTPR
ncbi:MAG TPA: ATP-binding cassette domain-containing protein, partial [Candidatus Handelsmanbacteria bacterium]|nr:ATP-binding cassette domain-containing protein [Candidatus Handelsmanbacteria bacterium]